MMRRLRSLMAIAAALLLASRSMRAQGGDAPTPKPVSFELRVAPTGILGERNYAFGTAVTATTGMMTGAEIIARWRYVGLGVRVFSGAFGDSLAGTKFKVVNGDVSLLAGPREFSAEAGYAKRALLSTTADQVFTFLLTHARDHLDPVVQAEALDAQEALKGPPLGLPNSVNHPADACVHQRSGAHKARFHGHHQSGSRQSIVRKTTAGFTKNHNFGMRRRIMGRSGLVKARGEKQARGIDEDGAHRHLVRGLRKPGLGERQVHQGFEIEGHESPPGACGAWCAPEDSNFQPTDS